MVFVFGSKSHAAAIIKPQSTPLWLFPWHFEPFLLPDPLDPFVVDTPSFVTQDGCDSAVAIASIHACELDNPLRQRQFIVSHIR
jgi:hypothetical protein